MGKIESQIKLAFDKFKKDGNLYELIRKLIDDADFSVRFGWQMSAVFDALKKHCPASVFECVYYDGENGEYHLFDFDPNIISKKSLLVEIKSRLQHEIGVEFNYLDKAMEDVYLINTNTMVKVR